MNHLISEDEKSFKLASGAVFPKTPHTMAPGGIYHQAKTQFLALGGQVQQPSNITAPRVRAPSAPSIYANGNTNGAGTEDDPMTFAEGGPVPSPDDFSLDTGNNGNPSSVQSATPASVSVPASAPATQTLPDVPVPVPAVAQALAPSQTMSKTSTEQMSPGVAAALQNDVNAQAPVLNQIADAQSAENAKLAGQYGATADILNKQNADTALRTDAYRTKADLADKALGESITALSNSNIKPKGVFDGDLGSNISAGLAIGLGALGGAYSGSNRNVGLEMINRAIDKDMEAQKSNRDTTHEVADLYGMRLRAAQQAGMNDAEISRFQREGYLSEVENRLKQIMATSASEQVRANAAKTFLDLQTKKDEFVGKENKTTSTKETAEGSKTALKVPDKDLTEWERLNQNAKDLDEISQARSKLGTLQTGALAGRVANATSGYSPDVSKYNDLASRLRTNDLADSGVSTRFSKEGDSVLDQRNESLKDTDDVAAAKRMIRSQENNDKRRALLRQYPQLQGSAYTPSTVTRNK